MSDAVRDCLFGGCLLFLAYLIIRSAKTKNPRDVFGDLPLAIVLIVALSPIPGAVNMLSKALGKQTLPIFNSFEERAALVLGGALLLISIVYGIVVALLHAARSSSPDTKAASAKTPAPAAPGNVL